MFCRRINMTGGWGSTLFSGKACQKLKGYESRSKDIPRALLTSKVLRPRNGILWIGGTLANSQRVSGCDKNISSLPEASNKLPSRRQKRTSEYIGPAVKSSRKESMSLISHLESGVFKEGCCCIACEYPTRMDCTIVHGE